MVRLVIRRLILAAIATASVGAPAAFATAPASAATGKPAARPAVVNWPTVRENAKGERVRTIELLLNQRGFPVPVDGVYGQDTATAVGRFQMAANLKADGIVGPATWQKLVITVGRGSRSNAVLAVERWLRYVYGYRSVIVDRIFGPRTEAAVRNVQFNHRLRVDGIVGPATWKVIVAG
jgi:peptidoglycan hydrolase-like protein with peptidoglycan-binding domain